MTRMLRMIAYVIYISRNQLYFQNLKIKSTEILNNFKKQYFNGSIEFIKLP